MLYFIFTKMLLDIIFEIFFRKAPLTELYTTGTAQKDEATKELMFSILKCHDVLGHFASDCSLFLQLP